MAQLLAIAAGGAIGALMRFWLSSSVYAVLGRGFPYGTLSVNVIGSFAMGLLTIYVVERWSLGGEWRAFLLIGLLGAFTTFSAFSMETLDLIEQTQYFKALANMLLSVLLCVAAVMAGVMLARQMN